MRNRIILFGIVALCAGMIETAPAGDPTKQELLDAVGIQPSRTQRGQMDTVGFVTTAAQMDAVIRQSGSPAAPPLDAPGAGRARAERTAILAAICPHDDYYYASRLYATVIPHVEARRVIVFGVFHKARVFGSHDRLVFDAFRTWRGPYGPVAVSPLRADLIATLPPGDYVVDNDMHTVEHSVEAIVPWLQAFNREVEIVPILVPYMGWETMDRIAGEFSEALSAIMRERGWRLGRDVAVICSADAVHYGDAGWGGAKYADFGTDIDGYRMAVARDSALIASDLAGPIRRESLRRFLYTCADPDDVMHYKLTWCGRFSVPFGLDVASRVCETLQGRPLEGTLRGYGTSLSEISLDLDAITGLGATAPNNLHHWVGYPAITYR